MVAGYLAVGNKCAVDFARLRLPVDEKRALSILWQLGFRVVRTDPVARARSCVGSSRYRRGAGVYLAPFCVDCSSLVKWVYAKSGVWLPRHSIDQRESGESVPIDRIHPGDLVFVQGVKPYWYEDPSDGVGHVGICTGESTVIHAANPVRGVVEDEMSTFIDNPGFRGIRRIVSRSTVTLESPANRRIEWSGEIRNIIVQNLELP